MSSGFHRRAIAFLLLAVLVCAAGAETRRRHREKVVENTGSPQVNQAEQLMGKGAWTEAAPLLEQATAADQKNYLAWYDLGYVYSQLGKPTESIAAYRKSVEANPQIYESNLNLGLSLAEAGDPEAEKYLTAATQLKPTGNPPEGTYRAWLSLGHLLADKDRARAVAALKQASALNPSDPEPHVSAGFLLEKSGDLQSAETELQSALKLDPNSLPATMGLANVYMKTNRLAEAKTMLGKVISADPANASAHLQLGRVLNTEGKSQEAAKEFAEGLKSAPNDAELQREAAAISWKAGDFAAAEKSYRALIATEPNDAELHQSLARVLKREHKYDEAIEQLQIAIKLNPKAEDAYVDLAFTAAAAQNYPLSQAVLDVRAREFPENAAIYFLRATNLDHLQDIKNAAIYYRKFLAEANGKYPDQEWEARHRLILLEGGVKLPQGRSMER